MWNVKSGRYAKPDFLKSICSVLCVCVWLEHTNFYFSRRNVHWSPLRAKTTTHSMLESRRCENDTKAGILMCVHFDWNVGWLCFTSNLYLRHKNRTFARQKNYGSHDEISSTWIPFQSQSVHMAKSWNFQYLFEIENSEHTFSCCLLYGSFNTLTKWKSVKYQVV